MKQSDINRINKGMIKRPEIAECPVTIYSLRNECCSKPENQRTISGMRIETGYFCEKCRTIVINNLNKLWEHDTSCFQRLIEHVDVDKLEFRKCDEDDPNNHEYAIFTNDGKNNVHIGYIEFYPPDNDFIFEPWDKWSAISYKNLIEVAEFITKLREEKQKALAQE